MRVGIFGGSFNPIHAGHLKLAHEAFSVLNLERVIFVPSFQTPLKNPRILLPAAERLKRLRSALKPYPHFSVSLCEIERKGVSYTVDTLKFLKTKFRKDAVLYFLTGADTLKKISKWKSVDEIKKLCRFVVASRPGYTLKVPSWAMALPMDALNVSSTQIRRSLS